MTEVTLSICLLKFVLFIGPSLESHKCVLCVLSSIIAVSAVNFSIRGFTFFHFLYRSLPMFISVSIGVWLFDSTEVRALMNTDLPGLGYY